MAGGALTYKPDHMENRPFIIDQHVLEEIARVKAYAETHPLSLIDLIRRMKDKEPIGNDRGYCLQIPWGYRVVYSIETQVIGKTHHLSVSVTEQDPRAMPHMVPMNLILWAFGIGAAIVRHPEELAAMMAFMRLNKIPTPEPATIITIYGENCGPDCKAVNVIAQLEKDKQPEEESNARDGQPKVQ